MPTRLQVEKEHSSPCRRSCEWWAWCCARAARRRGSRATAPAAAGCAARTPPSYPPICRPVPLRTIKYGPYAERVNCPAWGQPMTYVELVLERHVTFCEQRGARACQLPRARVQGYLLQSKTKIYLFVACTIVDVDGKWANSLNNFNNKEIIHLSHFHIWNAKGMKYVWTLLDSVKRWHSYIGKEKYFGDSLQDV